MVYRSVLILLLATQLIFAANPSPLADAAEQGNITLVKSLLQQHADVNAAQGDGMTALHWAAMRDDATLAQILIGAKANLDPMTRLGNYTPLYLAAKNGNANVAEVLLKAGADGNQMSSTTGATVLMVAAGAGSARIVEALIAK